MENFFSDVAYLLSDVVTGKSVPLLMYLSRVQMDRSLMGVMVLAGVVAGTIMTFLKSRIKSQDIFRTWFVRAVNHVASVLFSIYLYVFLVRNTEHNLAAIRVVPAFFVTAQYVPERPSAALVLILSSMTVFGISSLLQPEHELPAGAGHVQLEERALHVHESYHTLSRSLLAFTEQEWRRKRSKELHAQILDNTSGSLISFFLSFYAAMQHGPMRDKQYLSQWFSSNWPYALWVLVIAAVIRAYVYLSVGWLHEGQLHLLMDEDEDDAHWMTAAPLCVCLLFSAAWSSTQITEQILTIFQGHRLDLRLKLSVWVYATATLLVQLGSLPALMAVAFVALCLSCEFLL